MRAGVFRVAGVVDERAPAGFDVGGRVVVAVTVADGRDGTPEAVVVLGIHHRDHRVVHRLAGGGQQARVLRQVAAGRLRHKHEGKITYEQLRDLVLDVIDNPKPGPEKEKRQ